MGRRYRIPALLDLVVTDRPKEILAAADDPVLDRGAAPFGPVLNRLILAAMKKTLHTGTESLPSARPRDAADRIVAQQALAGRLAPGETPWNDDSLESIADYLRGGRRALGPLCQEAIGRLFDPGFEATAATWRAATVMDRALTLRNPALRLLWWLTGEVKDAQETLSKAVGGDASAVHAIGVAVHTFLRSVERMDKVLADPEARRSLSTKGALGRCIAAPDVVLRYANAHATIAAGEVAPGTLVLFRLDAAARNSVDARVAFLSESWSACPADRVVPAMLAEIWYRVTGERHPPAETA